MNLPPQRGSTPVLRSPVVLAGLAVVVIALIAVVAVVLVGGDGGSSEVQPANKTPSPEEAETGAELTGKAKATINVRSGPGNDYEVLGVLRRDSEVRIVAKSEDAEWLQVIYPPRSKLRGWVLAESLEVEGDMSAVAIATPEEIPLPEVPTSPPVEETETPQETPTEEEPTPTPSPTPIAELPDLAISGALVSGGVLVVTITNQGSGDLSEAMIDVSVFDMSGTQTLHSMTSGPHTLSPGMSIDIKTEYAALTGPSQLLVIVDPQGLIAETDDTNNRLTVAISGGEPPPTGEQTPEPSPGLTPP